jgi:hypothetical protein
MISTRENRLRRLELLIAEAGGQAALAERIGRDRNQVWQWTLPSDDSRGRGIGDKMARLLEVAMEKPPGWMDQETPRGTEGSSSTADNDAKASSPAQSMRPDADSLRTALEITERVLTNARVSVTAQARADITLAVYDLIREGHGIAGAERTVSHMLRAVGGLTAPTE